MQILIARYIFLHNKKIYPYLLLIIGKEQQKIKGQRLDVLLFFNWDIDLKNPSIGSCAFLGNGSSGPMSILWTKKLKDYAAFLNFSFSLCCGIR